MSELIRASCCFLMGPSAMRRMLARAMAGLYREHPPLILSCTNWSM
jgi:hypothetical protein